MKNLIDKFFEGKTSNSEEQELRNYFAQGDVDPELQQYAGFFNYMENDFAKELQQIERPRQIVFRRWIAAATSVAAAIILAIAFTGKSSQFDPYEGSYMVVNGVKYYDREQIIEQERLIQSMREERSKEYNEIMKRR